MARLSKKSAPADRPAAGAWIGWLLAILVGCSEARGAAAPSDSLSGMVIFRPSGIVCARSPCPGSRPAVPIREVRPTALRLTDRVLQVNGRVYRREDLQIIRLRNPPPSGEHGEPAPPEDMVSWADGLRTFGPVRVSNGLVEQPGLALRPLADALEISFGRPRPERISPVVLRIGELRHDPAAPEGLDFDHWNCSAVLAPDARRAFERLRDKSPSDGDKRAVGQDDRIVYWAEFMASRREGLRYGPDRQKLCQFDVDAILLLRQRAPTSPSASKR